MWMFYISLILLVVSVVYTIYENKKNTLRYMIYNKQLEFGQPSVKYKTKSFGKYGVAITVVATMIITPFTFDSNKCDSVYCFNEDLFQVVEVSAGEYVVNAYGEGFSFGINVLKENESILLLDDKYPYYENYMKYITMNHLAQMETISIDGNLYVKVTIDNKYHSFIIVEVDEFTTETRVIDFELEDFENDVYLLIELLQEYPPRVVRKYFTDEEYDDTLKINEDYVNIVDPYHKALYESYFESLTSKSRDYEPIEMRRIEVNYKVSNDLEIIQHGLAFYGIDKIQSEDQVKRMQYDSLFSNNPFWTIKSESAGSIGTSYNYDDGDVEKYPGKAFTNQIKTEEYIEVYSTIIIDISEFKGKLSDITVNGTLTASLTEDIATGSGWTRIQDVSSNDFEITDFYILENLLVIPPIKVLTVDRDGSHDAMIDYDILIDIDGYEVKLETGMGFNVYWH